MNHAQRQNRSIEIVNRRMQDYLDIARQNHHVGGVCEIDCDAEVSLSEDNGAYVQAWIWISDDEVNA